jgi:hypothetical protein
LGDKFLPGFAINSFIALCTVLLGICIMGYISALVESKTALEAYSFILGFAIIVLGVYGGLLTFYSEVFDSYYAVNYGDLMGYVDTDEYTISEMGCYGGKYVDNLNSTNYYDLKCDDKLEIAYMWEDDMGKDIDD